MVTSKRIRNISAVGQGGSSVVVPGTATWGGEFGGGSPYLPAVIGSPFLSGIQMNFTGTSVLGSPAITNAALAYTGTSLLGSPFIPTVSATFTGTSVLGGGSLLQWQLGSEFICLKDTWVDTVAGCTVNGSRDGLNLNIDSTVATSKDTYTAWDVTQIGSGTTNTMIGGSLFLRCIQNPPVASVIVNLFAISNGSETWNESTLNCSTRPAAVGGTRGSFLVTTTNSGTDAIAVFNPAGAGSGVLSRINERMGSGICTVLVQMASVASTTTFITKGTSGGVANALGPRLQFTYKTVG